MQYWIKPSLALGLLMTLSGCSVFINDAHHPRNYRAYTPVTVPSSLQAPATDRDFAMDEAQYSGQAEESSLRPPQQVLTLAQGTWIEEGDKQSRIFFDKNDGVESLSNAIWEAIEGALKNLNASASSANKGTGVLETGWLSLIQAKDGWFWEDNKVPSEHRFKFTIVQQEHKRTASLLVELVDFRSDSLELTDLLKQQLEVRALNEVVGEYDFQYRRLLAEQRQSVGQLAIAFGLNEAGQPALVLSTDYDRAFDKVSTMLEALNFNIEKVNLDESTIAVEYEKPQDSVWNSIWGDEGIALPLENGKYTIKISATKEGGSVLTWLDEKDQVLDTQMMQTLQQALLDALRQKDVKL